jgi:hypothetical protein
MPRRGCRKDLNHDEIAECFRDLGWQWWDTYQVAQFLPGFTDGLAIKRGVVVLIEVKSGKGTLTSDEATFHLQYAGPIEVARNQQDVIAIDQKYMEGGTP